ncbi:hypothetical protein EVAR_84390_1, partial [Eumeta japonica]
MQQYGGGGASSSYMSTPLYNQPYYPSAHTPNNRSSCKAAPTYLSAYGVGVGGVTGGGFTQPSPYAYSSYNGGLTQSFQVHN